MCHDGDSCLPEVFDNHGAPALRQGACLQRQLAHLNNFSMRMGSKNEKFLARRIGTLSSQVSRSL